MSYRPASLCSLAGRYYNPIPTRLLTPIDGLSHSKDVKKVLPSFFYIFLLKFPASLPLSLLHCLWELLSVLTHTLPLPFWSFYRYVPLVSFASQCLHFLYEIFSRQYGSMLFYCTDPPTTPALFSHGEDDSVSDFCKKSPALQHLGIFPQKNKKFFVKNVIP